MIRKTVFEKIPCLLEPCSLRIKGFCGGTRTLRRFIKAVVEADDVKFVAVFFVADDDLLEEDVLIGQKIFTGKKVRGVVKDGQFKFEKNVDVEFNMKHGNMDDGTKLALFNMVTNFNDIFAENLSQIGKTDVVEMKIELDTDKPIAQPPYRIPEPKKRVVNEMVNDLLENDIISPSQSEYASPIILVKKKDGTERLCVDYRMLNRHMNKQIYPMPNIEERLQDATQYKIFSTLDLNSGYYQIPIEPLSRKYTAFVTTDGIYEFKRMPFGLKNSPIEFQRLMAKLKEKTRPGDMIHYMDDILIGAENETEMLEKLNRIFAVLREFKLTLNPRKCEFFQRSITFLGHRLTGDGIQPGEIKTDAIINFKCPENITEVRRFFGLSGYFRKFVPAYAIISEPLRKLLRKDEPFNWTEDQQTAFLKLQNILVSEPVLTAYDVNAQHQLHTDASSIGLAAVLMQNVNDTWKPVAYYSRSTSPTERHMHSYELETLAVVEGLERFKYYVFGKPIKVITDCNAVKTAMTKKDLIPRIARWWLRIQEYDIDIEHRSEQQMCHVDALSRKPNEQSRELEPATLQVDKVDIDINDWLFSMQLQDQKLQEIAKKVGDKDKEMQKCYVLDHGRLYKIHNQQKLWVVPKSLRYKVTQDAHEKTGHLSVDRTIEKIQQLMWLPRMRNFVKSFVKSCVECAYNKQPGGTKEGEYHFSDVDPVPFKTIHLDHLGPFPKSCKRNEHVLVLIDAFTKYTIIRAVPSTATKYVVKILDDVTSFFGMPDRIISDRGTAFTSKDFKKYCNDSSIKHVLNAVRTPRANGQVERMNRTILSMLLPSTQNERRWDDELRTIQWTINDMKNSTTGCSPHELLYGFQPLIFWATN